MDYSKQRVGREHVVAHPRTADGVVSALRHHGWTASYKTRDGVTKVKITGRTPKPTHEVLRTMLRRAKTLPVGGSIPIGDGGRWFTDHFGDIDRRDVEDALRVLRRETRPKRFKLSQDNRTLIRLADAVDDPS